jgi:RNA polymerase sigma-70 factor (ECF subfamily)
MKRMANGVSPTDLDLLQDARQGQWEAFEALVERYESRVFGLAWRLLQHRQDAEDATQLTFISFMEHLGRFRAESSVATWLLRIAANQALTILRKRRGSKTVSLENETDGEGREGPLPLPDYIAHWRQDPSELAQRAEVNELLADALAELDEKYRVVFVLRDLEGFTVKEAAEWLGISVPNVKVRLLRARLQLRERLTRVLGDETTRMIPKHDH